MLRVVKPELEDWIEEEIDQRQVRKEGGYEAGPDAEIRGHEQRQEEKNEDGIQRPHLDAGGGEQDEADGGKYRDHERYLAEPVALTHDPQLHDPILRDSCLPAW